MTVDITQDYFSLFALRRIYELDLHELESAYQKIQSFVHPDRHAQADAGLRREVMQKAAFVNEAYRVLKDPLARGLYLLELSGFDKGSQVGTLDQVFLMSQMEAREFLSDVRSRTAPLQRLQSFKLDLDNQIIALYNFIGENFKLSDHKEAYKNLLKQQFLNKVYQECQEIELVLLEEEN